MLGLHFTVWLSEQIVSIALKFKFTNAEADPQGDLGGFS